MSAVPRGAATQAGAQGEGMAMAERAGARREARPDTSPARRATVKMVAEAAGVSTATVSYVLSGRAGGGAGAAPATVERVRQAARELRYRPNSSARAMRTGRTGVALLSLHMMSDPWSLAVSEAVAQEARSDDLVPLVLADGDWFDALERQDCDVAYLDSVPDDAATRQRLVQLVDRGIRLVVFSETLEPRGFDVVRSLALPGCGLAVAHLLDEHEDVACLAAASAAAGAGPNRYTVYAEALADRGIAVRPERVATFEESQASAFAGALALLDREDRPRAIYATTDFAAIAAIGAAHRLGLRVPEDVAVAGVGNTPDGELSTPALTTVGPESFFTRQARLVTEVAREGVVGDGRVHEFPWSLVVRESTGGTSTASRAPRATPDLLQRER